MKRLTRVCAALGLAVGITVLAAPPLSAGQPALTVEVTGAAVCLDTGQVQVTWVATVNPPPTSGTTLVPVDSTIVIDGLRSLQGGTGQATVQFEGTQSGALTGDVAFNPFQQTVPASNDSFPVSSQAVAVGSAPDGGTVDLAVDVLIFDPANPEQNNFTVFGEGSVDLPVCAQPVVSATAAAAGETRPRFTG